MYARFISRLAYPTVVYARSISLLAYPTVVYIHYWHTQLPCTQGSEPYVPNGCVRKIYFTASLPNGCVLMAYPIILY